MINTEHIIKRKVVSYEAYNQDSDEEFMNDYRMDPRRKKHARRRQYDPKYYDNDSDFESADEDAEMKNKNRLRKQAFDKVQVAPQRTKGVLTALMASMSPILSSQDVVGRAPARSIKGIKDKYHQEPRYDHADRGGALVYNFILTVYFGEYLNEEPLKLEITGPWTVKETIAQAITAWNKERVRMALKGRVASNYAMRSMDVDEIDLDVPAFGAQLKVHDINEKSVGLTFVDAEPVAVPSDPSSVIQFKNATEQILVKVSIPGPNNESHVLAIDKDATALKLRDLISLLNKKKHGAHFHPHYFNFYYYQQTKAKELPLKLPIIELAEPRELILLPKFLTANDDVNEAFNFKLVRLANEKREYQCTKIRNARKNQKRLLIVDRHWIVKKAMDYNLGTNDHAPIDITSIIDCSLSDKNNNEFSIEYRKKQGGKRHQRYELETDKECKDIVNKIRYLITLRTLLH
eukprot:69699_1